MSTKEWQRYSNGRPSHSTKVESLLLQRNSIGLCYKIVLPLPIWRITGHVLCNDGAISLMRYALEARSIPLVVPHNAATEPYRAVLSYGIVPSYPCLFQAPLIVEAT